MERSKIIFHHNGKQYEMTSDEIEAAYRYQRHHYLLMDAAMHLEEFVFGYTLEDPDRLTDCDIEEEAYFTDEYGITFEEAKKHLNSFVYKFESRQDCDIDENSTWSNAIRNVLLDLKDQNVM